MAVGATYNLKRTTPVDPTFRIPPQPSGRPWALRTAADAFETRDEVAEGDGVREPRERLGRGGECGGGGGGS